MASTDSGTSAATGRAGGLLVSLRRLLGNLLEVVQTRVEIVATEFEEERERLRELVVYGFLTLFFFGFGLALLTLFLILAFWDSHRLFVVGGFALAYLAAGVVALAVLRAKSRSRPRLFAATVSELKKDREQLAP